jgi:hypothetical protein
VVRPEGGKKKYVSRRGRDRVRGAGSLSIESSDGGYWLPKKRTGVESSRSRRGAPVAPVEKEEIRDLGIRSIEREAQSDGGRSDNHSDNGSVEEHKEENGEGDDDIREESGDVSECGIIEGGDPGDTPGTVSFQISTPFTAYYTDHWTDEAADVFQFLVSDLPRESDDVSAAIM